MDLMVPVILRVFVYVVTCHFIIVRNLELVETPLAWYDCSFLILTSQFLTNLVERIDAKLLFQRSKFGATMNLLKFRVFFLEVFYQRIGPFFAKHSLRCTTVFA